MHNWLGINFKFRKIILLTFLVALLLSCADKKNSITNSKFISLENWQYHWNDSHSDSANNNSNWINLSQLDKLPQNNSLKTLWLRTNLPNTDFVYPAIYLGQVEQYMQVFLGERLIYQLGDFPSPTGPHFLGWHKNLIELPDNYQMKNITFLFLSDHKTIGPNDKILLGSSNELYKEIFTQNIDDIIFAAIFFFIGIASLVVYLFFLKTRLILSIALFLIPMSLFIVSNSSFLQLMFLSPTWFYHLDHFSLYLASIGGFFAIEQIVLIKYKRIVRIVWLVHLICLVVDLFSNIIFDITHPSNFIYFLGILSINMLICISVMVFSVRKGGIENKLLMTGMILFVSLATIEIVIFLSGIWDRNFGYSVKVIHFGVLFFVIGLISIIVYNYLLANKEKEIAQEKTLEAIKHENKIRADFSRKLIELQENERNRIALELHDSVGQKLLLIKNKLLSSIRDTTDAEQSVSLNQTCNLTGSTIQEIRNISQNLRPQHLDQLGLTTAIDTMIEVIERSSDIKFESSLDNIDDLLKTGHEINFYRIIQESLNNIVKHSSATVVSIIIKKSNKEINLEISDNGIGIDKSIDTFNNTTGGMGIAGMHERAKMISAHLVIDQLENSGTVIKLNYYI